MFRISTQAASEFNSASKHLRTFYMFSNDVSLIIKTGDHIKLANTRYRTRFQNKIVSKRSDTQQLTHCEGSDSFEFTCSLRNFSFSWRRTGERTGSYVTITEMLSFWRGKHTDMVNKYKLQKHNSATRQTI